MHLDYVRVKFIFYLKKKQKKKTRSSTTITGFITFTTIYLHSEW